MYKNTITLLFLIVCTIGYSQTPKVENLKVSNKINFTPVFPTADNSKLPAKPGDLFYADLDSSLYIYRKGL